MSICCVLSIAGYKRVALLSHGTSKSQVILLNLLCIFNDTSYIPFLREMNK